MPLQSNNETVCKLEGRVAYCAQTPWIQNITLRDNVLFGADYADETVAVAYEKALDAAALRPDLSILPHGDLTESKLLISACPFSNRIGITYNPLWRL